MKYSSLTSWRLTSDVWRLTWTMCSTNYVSTPGCHDWLRFVCAVVQLWKQPQWIGVGCPYCHTRLALLCNRVACWCVIVWAMCGSKELQILLCLPLCRYSNWLAALEKVFKGYLSPRAEGRRVCREGAPCVSFAKRVTESDNKTNNKRWWENERMV